MHRSVAACACVCALLAACGGGGERATPAASPEVVRLVADPVTIGSAQYDVEVGVRLALPAGAAPALVAATIDVPPELTLLAPGARPATPLADFEFAEAPAGLRVLAGDARNVAAAPLSAGPLFWLRVAPSLPRTPGTYRVALRDVAAATRDGAVAAATSAPAYVDVVVE